MHGVWNSCIDLFEVSKILVGLDPESRFFKVALRSLSFEENNYSSSVWFGYDSIQFQKLTEPNGTGAFHERNQEPNQTI